MSKKEGLILQCNDEIYYQYDKKAFGVISRLALQKGDYSFKAYHQHDNLYRLVSDNMIEIEALLKKSKGEFIVDKCLLPNISDQKLAKDTFNIDGEGNNGWRLRKAQKGALHSLLSHWSLSNEVATIVLPTGTGKTDTMLAAYVADKAERLLVIVPTKELRKQLSDNFSTWGILKKLGVISEDALNPVIFTVNRTISDVEYLKSLKEADIVVTTPLLLSKAPTEVKEELKSLFTHVYFDEAHHVVAKTWNELKSLFSNTKVVQFTATPYRNDRLPIEGKVVYNYPLSLAVEDGCFSKISLVTVNELHPKKKDQAIALAAMERLNADRQKGFHNHVMMVRANNTEKARKLKELYQELFPDENITLIHSGIAGKADLIDEIKNHQYSIVICVEMLKEGFDYPNFKVAAVHDVHKSLSVIIQFIGRFTRTQQGLGDASFVVNYADEKMSTELENLFQEGCGWEDVVSEIADRKKQEAESLLTFLQNCRPFSSFDSPDTNLNPKLVYPALSCVVYQCNEVDWSRFYKSFNLKKYSLSQPYENSDERVFYFTTQKRDKVKWARAKEMKDQVWDLIVMHHDPDNKLLYIGYSEKRLDVPKLVNDISLGQSSIIDGDPVFRSFDSIKRLSIIHAGIFKPANHLHRYSRLSGADVTTELSRWKNGVRCKKSDFVGVGFRGGFPVSIAASIKGKIWSPARSGNLQEWKAWCLEIGKMVTDENIDSNQLLEDSAEKTQIYEYPDELVVLATDWADTIFDKIHRITIERQNSESFLLSEADLKFISCNHNSAELKLALFDKEYQFKIELGGEDGHKIIGLENSMITIEGVKTSSISIQQFFEENPPTLFLLNGCTISGAIHTDYGDCDIHQLPYEQIEALKWEDVDFTNESMYKSAEIRPNSIQQYMMDLCHERGASIVFNDDNSGESADIVAIYVEEGLVRFEMIHCKYSKTNTGMRKSDLYEVCGQAIISLRYKWKPEELLKHLERRNAMGVLKGKRFYRGNITVLNNIKEALKYSDVKFEFAIAQPGIDSSILSDDINRLLGSVYSTVIEMTETKLKCYFS